MDLQIIKDSENPIVLEDLDSLVTSFPLWEFFRDQSIFITGGNGHLASYLLRSLLYANHLLDLNLNITCLARSHRSDLFRLLPWISSPSLDVVYGPVESYAYCGTKPHSIVIHAASGATPSVYQYNPVGIILPNSVGTMRLCHQAHIWNSKRFLFFSSGEVYGTNKSLLFSEDSYGYLDPCSLRSCYAESKRCGESTCVAYSHQYGLHVVIARIFHTYGPQMKLDDGRVFQDFIRDALEGREIRISSLGDARRSFCYLSDATRGFLHLIVHGSSGEAYNLSNPATETSIRDLANLIANLSDPPREVCFVNEKHFKPGYMCSPVHRSLPSIAKIQKLGWNPVVDLHQGTSRTFDSYLN